MWRFHAGEKYGKLNVTLRFEQIPRHGGKNVVQMILFIEVTRKNKLSNFPDILLFFDV